MEASRTVSHCAAGAAAWDLDAPPSARYCPVSEAGSAAMNDGGPVPRPSAVLAGAGAHIDQVVSGPHGLLVVLDHDDRVAEVSQPQQRVDEPAVVALVKANAGFVEDVEHADERRADLVARRMRWLRRPTARRQPARA